MRVVAGVAKGRRLVAPRGDATRPTSDFVREAIFNVLQAIVDLDGATVVDLYAGTGALGIEALSRGARSCVFVEKDPKAAGVIRANLASTGLTGGEVVRSDVLAWLDRPSAADTFDLAFADPPYAFDDWSRVGGVHARVLVAESDREVDVGTAWEILRSKRYGSTVVTLFQHQETL